MPDQRVLHSLVIGTSPRETGPVFVPLGPWRYYKMDEGV